MSEVDRENHVLRELGFTVESGDGDTLRGTAPVIPEACVPGTGVLRTSVLAAWADTLTGLLTVGFVHPRVPVTIQLDVNLYRPPEGRQRVHAVARMLKVGQTVSVADTDFADEEGNLFGAATALFTASPDPDVRMPDGPNPLDLMREPIGFLAVPLAERAGCERSGPGVSVLPRRPDGLNSAGTVNGGLLALVVEEAALSAAPPRATLAMLAMRYVRPVRQGPAVASATVHGTVAEVIVRDAGRDGDDIAVVATTRTFA